MALTVLIREKATGQSASAIHAIPAIRKGRAGSKIAKIASIPIVKPAMVKERILKKLKLFRFGPMAHEIKDGYLVDDLERVNNMAWEFMQIDGMVSSAALHLVAQIVTKCDLVASEAAYEDIRALWDRLTRNLD
jgi:hypothetical protein